MSDFHVNYWGYGTSLYNSPLGSISGFPNCCSASAVYGLGAIYCGLADDTIHPNQIFEDPTAQTMWGWFDKFRSSQFGVPIEYVRWAQVDIILSKVHYGFTTWKRDGYQGYKTRTILMTDKDRRVKSDRDRSIKGQPEGPYCSQFMEWLSTMPTKQVGSRVSTQWADGAHGGQVRGMVWAPNSEWLERKVQKVLQELNEYSTAVCASVQRTTDAVDEIGKLW